MVIQLRSLSNARLEAAAATLIRDPALNSPDADESGLLRHLGYDDGHTGAAAGRARMLCAAASFRRLFNVPMPDAPGLVFFGAEAGPATLGPQNSGLPVGGFAGSGLDARRAFESCVGEGVEYLSQFAAPEDLVEVGTFAAFAETLDPGTRGFVKAVFSASGLADDRAVSWVRAKRLMDGKPAWYPADLCVRRAAPDFVPPLKLSTGCAAGVTLSDATLRGLLELIERDALALWWRGGRRARPIATETGIAAASLLAQVRRGQRARETHLLDITTDTGIPVVVAFSRRTDGYGFAFGAGARTSASEAARSAIFEMCQSELSLHVIAAKRAQSGEAALNESDLRQNARATMLDTRQCLLLQPDGCAADASSSASLEAIVRLLAECQIAAYSIDLTRPRFGVPVVRVVAPALQNEPCKIDTERLLKMIAKTDGGARHTGGMALL